ncbi:hypothetical protein F5Y16DRAFT_411939 [Xylariaceae sp. FL0255]|nr:hypothetical protein F5Y16DRAFT_411939 [Xylariaceae sp. FL0255]
MDDFLQNLEVCNRSFLRTDLSALGEILAVFLGGSRLYKQQAHTLHGSESTSDYDGILVVPTKKEIHSLLTTRDRRQTLAEVVGIEQAELADLEVPCPSSKLWSEFDAIGFAGRGADGDERSVKLLNLADILRKETINLLTFKDRRVFDAVSPGRSRTLINQTTILPNGLKIQHDQWVYATLSNEKEHRFVAFGYMADLLLSSACVYDRDNYKRSIKKAIARLYYAKSEAPPTLHSFCRNDLFHPTYKIWLNRELASLYAPLIPNMSCSGAEARGDKWQVLLDLENASPRAPEISDETLRQFNNGNFITIEDDVPIISPDSSSFKARTENGAEIFVKKTRFAQDEKNGARMAAIYFSRVAKPRISANGELIYPLFRGSTKSDIRLSYIRSGYTDRDLAQRLLYAEMVQAEDTFRAYRQCLLLPRRDVDVPDVHPDVVSQRFFHDRLINDTWMRKSYGQGMKLLGLGQPVSFDRLLAMRWRINGHSYGSLRDAFDYSASIIAPRSRCLRACPIVFGLGDCHGGSGDVLFIDFKVSGYYPVMLDIAPPLFVDTMFETLYRQVLGDGLHNQTSCSIIDGDVFVSLKVPVNTLTQSILRIKMHYLIQPLCEEVRKSGVNLEDHVPILAVALFLCATLSSNLSDDPNAFGEAAAVGLTFLRAQTWDDIDDCFQRLGFRL